MASRYQRQMTIPEAFPGILEAFTREVLRSQPVDIPTFAATYFSDLLRNGGKPLPPTQHVFQSKQKSAGQAQAGSQQEEAPQRHDEEEYDVEGMTVQELQDLVMELFMKADVDRSGGLDAREFRNVMKHKALHLSDKEVRAVMAECDENDDGILQYREGMSRSDLELSLSRLFSSSDSDGSGSLDRREFRRCLSSSDLGLTRREINALMHEADSDGDGRVSYGEFVPVAWGVMVERMANRMMESEVLDSEDALSTLLLDEFRKAARPGEVTLQQREAKRVLQELSREHLGLTRLQVLMVMAEAEPDDNGEVRYVEFAGSAARVIRGMLGAGAESEHARALAVETISRTGGARLLHGLDEATVKDVLANAFAKADRDGGGALDMREVGDVLRMLGTGELALSTREIAALRAAVDENHDGVVHYRELVDFMFDVLLHLERESFATNPHAAAERLSTTSTTTITTSTTTTTVTMQETYMQEGGEAVDEGLEQADAEALYEAGVEEEQQHEEHEEEHKEAHEEAHEEDTQEQEEQELPAESAEVMSDDEHRENEAAAYQQQEAATEGDTRDEVTADEPQEEQEQQEQQEYQQPASAQEGDDAHEEQQHQEVEGEHADTHDGEEGVMSGEEEVNLAKGHDGEEGVMSSEEEDNLAEGHEGEEAMSPSIAESEPFSPTESEPPLSP
eukprot:jgi/Chlat1/6478/Chrsp45S06056